jgi:hypothetical protein
VREGRYRLLGHLELPDDNADGSASTQRNALAIETINLGGCLTPVPYR